MPTRNITARPGALIDRNIRIQYEIQKARWIWHKDLSDFKGSQVVKFRCCWEVKQQQAEIPIHVSADNRYELFLNGQLISRGPDRCDPYHWSFTSYNLKLEPGKHCLEARVWFLDPEIAPIAQMSMGYGGFILAGEGEYSDILNTGRGNWQVAIENGWKFAEKEEEYFYRMVGPSLIMDGAGLHQEMEFTEPVIVSQAVYNNDYGCAERGHMLYPSPLPEQLFAKLQIGRVRAVNNGDYYIKPEDENHSDIVYFQQLLTEDTPLTIPAETNKLVLIDLEDYYCGYINITLSRGTGSTVKILWAESLWLPDGNGEWIVKGKRNEIAGKKFIGFGDTILHDGKSNSEYRPFWWRSGRYVLLDIQSGAEPLTIENLCFYETRYPLEKHGRFSCSDVSINNFIPLAERGLEMCSHETFMDCPYYEQLMYVGDTRLELLTTYVLSHDIRLAKRAIELFDWSRSLSGLVAERYPAGQWQQSLTFSMIWVAVIKDFAWWQNDAGFVRKMLPGMRSMLEVIYGLTQDKAILEQHPGWSFMDWVPEWQFGVPVDNRTEVSGLTNLLWLWTLKNAAELERNFGDVALAERHERNASMLADSVIEKFWDKERGLIADDLEHQSFSEHGQCLALLSDILPEPCKNRCLENLLTVQALHRTTVYFSFYLFEVLNKFNRQEDLYSKLDFWKDLQKSGLKTPIETPEPSRSDCHAWGSHPLFHLYADIAGIRPAEANFRKVVISPKPYKLSWLKCEFPHHLGMLNMDLKFDFGNISGAITLPEGLTGELYWNSEKIVLNSGLNRLK